MVKNILILLLAFYILALFQTSFLVHFNISGIIPNIIFILVIIINIFEKPEKKTGFSAAFIGGFFLDVFSSHPIGFNILILFSATLFIKVILRRYVRIPFLRSI